jgi:hypothetical protein
VLQACFRQGSKDSVIRWRTVSVGVLVAIGARKKLTSDGQRGWCERSGELMNPSMFVFN